MIDDIVLKLYSRRGLVLHFSWLRRVSAQKPLFEKIGSPLRLLPRVSGRMRKRGSGLLVENAFMCIEARPTSGLVMKIMFRKVEVGDSAAGVDV